PCGCASRLIVSSLQHGSARIVPTHPSGPRRVGRGEKGCAVDANLIIGVLAGLLVGGGVVFAFLKASANGMVARAKADADQLRQTAQRDAESLAREIDLKAKQDQLAAKE